MLAATRSVDTINRRVLLQIINFCCNELWLCAIQQVNLSPRSSIEDVFNDGVHGNHRYSVFGRHQNQIPYVITSPPQQAFNTSSDPPDDVSDDEDDDDDVISLSTIPEVPSVMAGTLSPSEYLELGTTVGRKYRQQSRDTAADRPPEQTNTDTPEDRHLTNNSTSDDAPATTDHVTSSDESRDRDKLLAAWRRRRRLTMLLMSVVVIFFVILLAILLVVVIFLGNTHTHTHRHTHHNTWQLLPRSKSIFRQLCFIVSDIPVHSARGARA